MDSYLHKEKAVADASVLKYIKNNSISLIAQIFAFSLNKNENKTKNVQKIKNSQVQPKFTGLYQKVYCIMLY